jgi:thiamine biosynthesis lipoprotein
MRCPRWPAVVLAFCVLVSSGCTRQPEPVRLSGSIFGTTWSLVYPPAEGQPSREEVREALLTAFAVVDQSMNHYRPDSLISRFNRAEPSMEIEVDWDFTYVLMTALDISEISQGAYDVTVSPLSSLWGFGPEGPARWPAAGAIETARAKVGEDVLLWDPTSRQLAKRVSGVALDFSSIAKGYGVDLGADALDEMGLTSYLLDIGGEQRIKGLSPRGDAWRIAIERPDQGVDRVMTALSVDRDTGIATSGDYRNYFEYEGRRYSHLIDPRTGYPIAHDVVSVTVLHPSTAIADAWATALIVMGADDGMAVAEKQGLAVYLIRRSGDDYVTEQTQAMIAWLSQAGNGE